MENKNIKKIIVIGIIFCELSFFPLQALAQFTNFPTSIYTIINPLPVTDVANGSGGIVGRTANITAQAILAGADGLNKKCVTSEEIFEKTNSASQLGFSGLSVIGGDSVMLAQLQFAITFYNNAILCRQGAAVLLSTAITPNVFTSNLKQRMEQDVNTAIQTLKTRLESVQARYDNAKQGFWKTLVFNILIKTSKSVSHALVAKLVSNYKISNLVGYADALTTLVYNNQFIRDNFKSNQDQLIARAILENPIFRNQVPPAIFAAADASLGFDPKTLDNKDPQFYSRMASVGGSAANPYYQHTNYIGGVDQAHAAAKSFAQVQISQSNGYKAPVNCLGSLAQQKAIDAKYQAASAKLDNRSALLNDLNKAKQLGQPVKDADIKKAEADFTAAELALNNVPHDIGGTSTAISICEAIVSPANLIDKGIDQAFNAIGVNMGQYNNNNLPSFMNLIGDVASQIGSSLIFGGAKGAKNAAILNQGRVVAGVSGYANNLAASKDSENLAKGIIFTSENDSNTNNGYVFSWEIIKETIPNASFITISGDGISSTVINPQTKQLVPNKLPLNGNLLITTTKGGSYFLTVFDSNGKALTAVTATLYTGSQQAYNYAPSQTAVLGAYTERSAISPRGSVPHVSPRGE